VEDRQGEVAPAAFGRRLVHLQRVLEVEDLLCADAVVDEPVERRQQSGPTVEAVAFFRSASSTDGTATSG